MQARILPNTQVPENLSSIDVVGGATAKNGQLKASRVKIIGFVFRNIDGFFLQAEKDLPEKRSSKYSTDYFRSNCAGDHCRYSTFA